MIHDNPTFSLRPLQGSLISACTWRVKYNDNDKAKSPNTVFINVSLLYMLDMYGVVGSVIYWSRGYYVISTIFSPIFYRAMASLLQFLSCVQYYMQNGLVLG